MNYPAQQDRRRYPRDYMRNRLALCHNPEDPILFEEWADMTNAQLHPSNFVSLNNQGRFLDITLENVERDCYLVESLYNWVTSRYRASNPLTGQQLDFRTKTRIFMAYFYFLSRKSRRTAEENRHFRMLQLYREFLITHSQPSYNDTLTQMQALVQQQQLNDEQKRQRSRALIQRHNRRLRQMINTNHYRPLVAFLKISFNANNDRME